MRMIKHVFTAVADYGRIRVEVMRRRGKQSQREREKDQLISLSEFYSVVIITMLFLLLL